jgi:hypothetical protein
MIRIDEIYNNVFSPIVLSKPKQSMHYFDPFGSTDYQALSAVPLITVRSTAYLFWDQEPFFPEVHSDTIDWFYEVFINGGQKKVDVVFVTSEKNSSNINALVDNYGVKLNYYFFHGWAALDWFRGYNRTSLMQDFRHRNITNTFLCTNRIVSGKREHRIELFKELVSNDLISGNKISFPAVCPYSNEKIEIDNVTLPLSIDSHSGPIENESYKISLWDDAKESLLYVVTETVFKEQTLHLTEKIFKPIVMQMPFILVGAKHNLEYLRSYGFKTFNDFWSEDYDFADNDTRIRTIANLLSDINAMSIKEKTQLQKHLSPIVEHNFNWFYSNEFENILWKELNTMTDTWK